MRFNFNQSVVYWPKAGADNFGKPKMGSPVVLPCRIEDEVAETINSDGEKVLSSATVWVEYDLIAGGFMLPYGTQATIDATTFPSDNPKQDRRVREIISAGKIPHLKTTQSLRKAMLK